MKFSITCSDPQVATILFMDVDPSDNKLATKKMLEKDGKTFDTKVSDVLNSNCDPYLYVEFESRKFRTNLSPIKDYKPEDFVAKLDDYLYSFFKNGMPKT